MQTDGLEGRERTRKYEFAPTVQSAENSNFLWTLRRRVPPKPNRSAMRPSMNSARRSPEHTKSPCARKNEDGSDEMTIEVEVVDALAVSLRRYLSDANKTV